MPLKKLTGKVSNFQQATEITGTRHGRWNSVVDTQQVINFRVDNSPTVLKLKEAVDLADGEEVTVVGQEKKGVLKGIALRNNETGIVYSLRTWPIFLFAAIFLALGVPLVSVVIGLPIMALGAYLAYKGYINRKSVGMLQHS